MSQPHPEGRDPRVGELHLLGEVTWHGAPVHGGRTHALLAALVDAARPHRRRARARRRGVGPRPAARQPRQGAAGRGVAHPVPDRSRRGRAGRRRLPPRARRRRRSTRSRCATTSRQRRRRGTRRPDGRTRRSPGGRWAGAAPASGGDGPLAALRDDARRLRAEAGAVLGRSLSALGDHREALPLLEEAGVGDEETAAALLRSLAAVHGSPAALDRYAQVRARPRRPPGRRPGTGPGRGARRAARRRQPGQDRAAPRVDLPGRSRRRHPRAARPGPRVPGRVDPRPRGPGQDPARPPPRPGGRGAGRALRRAGRRRLARRRRRRGRLGPGRARLGERPARAHARAAQRRSRPGRTGPGRGTGPAHPRQLRARGRGRRRPRGLPGRVVPPPARGHHDPGAPRDLRRAGLPALAARRRRGIRAVRPTSPGRAARCRARPDHGAERRAPARRAPPGHRARGCPGARDVGRGHRPPPRRPVRPAARRRPHRSRPAPDAARGHRLVVEPVARQRTSRVALAVDLPRRLLARRRGCRARSRRARRRALTRRPVAAHGARLGPHRSVPDARDGAGVRPAAARRGRRGRRRPATPSWPGPAPSPSAVGDDLWSPRQVEAVREVARRGEQPRRRPARGAHPPRPVVGGAAAHGAGLVLDHPRREPARHRRRRSGRCGPDRLAAHRRAGRRGRLGRGDRRAQHRRRRDRWRARPAWPCSTPMASAPRRPGSAGWSPWSGRRCSRTPRARWPGSRPSPRSPTGRRPPSRGSGRPTTSRTPATRPAPSPRPSWRSRWSATPTARGSRRCCTPWSARSTPSSATPRRPCATRTRPCPCSTASRPSTTRPRPGPCSPSTPCRWGASTRPRSGWPRSSAPGAARATWAVRRWRPPAPRWHWPAGRSPRGWRCTGRRRGARRDPLPGDGRGQRAGTVGPVRREPGRHRPRRARHHPRRPRRGHALLPRAAGQVAPRARPAPALHGLPRRRAGAARARRLGAAPRRDAGRHRRAAPRAGRAVRLHPLRAHDAARRAPRERPRSGRPGWRRGCAATTPSAPPPACCPRRGPRSSPGPPA